MDRDARIKELAERLAALQGTTPDRVIERLLEREWAAREATPPPNAPGFAEETQAPLTARMPVAEAEPTSDLGLVIGRGDPKLGVLRFERLPPLTPEEKARAEASMAEFWTSLGVEPPKSSPPTPKSVFDDMWE